MRLSVGSSDRRFNCAIHVAADAENKPRLKAYDGSVHSVDQVLPIRG